MSDESQRTTRPCEDCGTLLLVGLEPIDASDDPELLEAGELMVGTDWCPNLGCTSNHVTRGLTRVGVNRYVCTVCATELTGPISTIFDHRRTH